MELNQRVAIPAFAGSASRTTPDVKLKLMLTNSGVCRVFCNNVSSGMLKQFTMPKFEDDA